MKKPDNHGASPLRRGTYQGAALAGRLQMDVSELGDELIDIAQHTYRKAARKLVEAAE